MFYLLFCLICLKYFMTQKKIVISNIILRQCWIQILSTIPNLGNIFLHRLCDKNSRNKKYSNLQRLAICRLGEQPSPPIDSSRFSQHPHSRVIPSVKAKQRFQVHTIICNCTVGSVFGSGQADIKVDDKLNDSNTFSKSVKYTYQASLQRKTEIPLNAFQQI